MKDILKIDGVIKYTRENEKLNMPLFISASNRKFRFAKQTAVIMGVKEGTRIVFFEFGKTDEWFMAIENFSIGSEKAYKVFKISNRSGFEFSASVLSRIIQMKLGRDCVLSKTEYEYQGKPVYKIEKRLG